MAKGAHPFQDTNFQICSAYSGSKGSKCTVGTGMAVSHNHGKPRADIPFLREKCMAHPIPANVKEIFQLMAACPVTDHFGLDRGFSIFGRGHVVDYCFNFTFIEHPILATPFKIGDSDRRSDLMAQHTVEIEHFSARKWFISQV